MTVMITTEWNQQGIRLFW